MRRLPHFSLTTPNFLIKKIRNKIKKVKKNYKFKVLKDYWQHKLKQENMIQHIPETLQSWGHPQTKFFFFSKKRHHTACTAGCTGQGSQLAPYKGSTTACG